MDPIARLLSHGLSTTTKSPDYAGLQSSDDLRKA